MNSLSELLIRLTFTLIVVYPACIIVDTILKITTGPDPIQVNKPLVFLSAILSTILLYTWN